jgi:hypothetical protein
MFKKIALGVVAFLLLAIAGFSAYVATRPTHYTVVRSHVVPGTPEVVAPYLTDLRQWILWNPWDELEPTSIKEYSDPASGVGAWYTWSGEQVGAGRMEITAITPTRVDYALHFTAPMDDHAVVVMELAPAGEGRTSVTWTIEGELSFMGRAMDVIVGMDNMLGADFERGLAKLERLLSAGR